MALVNCRECDQEISSGAKRCPHCGCKTREKGIGGCLAWVALGSLVIVLFALSSAPPEPSRTPAEPIKRTVPVDVVSSSWTVDDYHKAAHTLRLKNTADYQVRDVKIVVQYVSKTGTLLAAREHTVYEFIRPDQTIKVQVSDYAPKDAATASITVVSVKR